MQRELSGQINACRFCRRWCCRYLRIELTQTLPSRYSGGNDPWHNSPGVRRLHRTTPEDGVQVAAQENDSKVTPSAVCSLTIASEECLAEEPLTLVAWQGIAGPVRQDLLLIRLMRPSVGRRIAGKGPLQVASDILCCQDTYNASTDWLVSLFSEMLQRVSASPFNLRRAHESVRLVSCGSTCSVQLALSRGVRDS